MKYLTVSLYFPRLLRSKAEKKNILQLMCKLAPNLTPEFYGDFEPVRKPFRLDRIDQALESWHGLFLWRKKNPPSSGMFFVGDPPPRPAHACFTLETRVDSADFHKLLAFVQRLSTKFSADIGMVHAFTNLEIKQRQDMALNRYSLLEGLPRLYWANFFGAPYIKLFGRRRLLTAPAYCVHELAADLIYLQVTENVMDSRENIEGFEARCEKIELHLDRDAFLSANKRRNHHYNVPEFRFQKLSKDSLPDKAVIVKV